MSGAGIHIEVLCEEESAVPVITSVCRACVPHASISVHPFRGKPDLLGKLPSRLKGYANLGADVRVLVLVDLDNDDCAVLKHRLEQYAAEAGLPTKSAPQAGRFVVCNRIVVSNLESWLLGDEDAVRAAYPRVRPFSSKARYRVPDAVTEPTRALETLLQQAGEFRTGIRKVECASQIATHMQPNTNRSTSFAWFVEGVVALAS